MKNWGPFGEKESRGLLFSLGNDYEGHGPAMPKDTDSRMAKHLCAQLEQKCGLRYCCHIPYQTDGLAALAKNWSPNYLPIEDCFQKTKELIASYIESLSETLPPFEYVVIVNGHGGNRGLGAYFSTVEFPIPIHYLFAAELNLPAIIDFMQQSPRFSITKNEIQEYLAVKPGHACSFEHSIGYALGFVSEQDIRHLNDSLVADFYDTLKKYPVLGGLGGYIEFGGKEFDIMREEKPNLVECYDKFKADGKIILYPKLARGCIEFTLQTIISKIESF